MDAKSSPLDPATAGQFAPRLLEWFDTHGRHDLPWQSNPTPYRVWVSEIMLQQTQVATVIPYYLRFMERFPAVSNLANAETDQVLHLWTGLGYYARARNLHKAAQKVCQDFGGEFPRGLEDLESLPGIGRSTAGAIAALAMGQRATILDGNVKRVLTRYCAVEGWPEQTRIKNRLWEIAERLTPQDRVDAYTQAIMDLGATVCTRSKPACQSCPMTSDCRARQLGLTGQIPGKKPRKTLPVKAVLMLIFQSESQQVLLEKRPSQGIWGGLYSFPELAAETSEADAKTETVNQKDETLVGGDFALPQNIRQVVPDWLFATATDAPGDASPALELAPIRHSFSHYHLDITPVLTRVVSPGDRLADSDRWLWYPLDHSLEVGLAAPVKKLLDRLSQPDTLSKHMQQEELL